MNLYGFERIEEKEIFIQLIGVSGVGPKLAITILSGIGLIALTFASGALAILVSATVFYVGVCYFWPTMLGFVSERIPRSGALGLGMMGAVGMANFELNISAFW